MDSPISLMFAVAFSGLGFFSLFVSPSLLKPVRVSPTRKASVEMYIRNDDCFRQFCLLNREIVEGGECLHFRDMHTNHNNPPTQKNIPKMPRELKVFDLRISEYEGRIVLNGKYVNQSIYFLKHPFGSFSVGETGNEILFFPTLNIERSNRTEIIEPFEEGDFCHYLSEKETGLIKAFGSAPLNLQFLTFDKSQRKD